MSSAVMERTQGFVERARTLMTRLNLYYAAVALLVLVNLYLLAQMAFTWRTAHSQDDAALERQTVAMKAAEIAKKPLEGLDDKVTAATADADQFYAKRLPVAYSEVLAELGVLTKKQGVKLTRVQYADSPVLEGTSGALTEVRMDASLNGDYRPLVLFINSLERDKMFFLITGVTLTGQQSGMVGLRLRLTTYLRPAKGAAVPQKAGDSVGTDAERSMAR
ncbi:hypothetical protein [Edaphobacter albus]|uniref:hypothetical protein n=1 Tax=Edaphobacter sp. 4G125 TaxID=2763071 RepID=UPI001646439B|nr:hypothetical protein [Edaphobacter sp. 4G125]QNI36205.1 hypothetical protein H7846_14625 [Edaphobacter sp. 4G125]